MRKQRVSGEFMEYEYGMKYSWKGHKDRNRHKNRIKRNGQARLVYVKNINSNIPTTWRWARGTYMKILPAQLTKRWISTYPNLFRYKSNCVCNCVVTTNLAFLPVLWRVVLRPDMTVPWRVACEFISWLGSHTVLGQWHSQPTLSSLGQRCMSV